MKLIKLSLIYTAAIIACSQPLYAAQYQLNTKTLPILNHGKLSTAQHFSLKTQKKRTITAIELDTSASHGVDQIEEVSIYLTRQQGDLLLAKGKLERERIIFKQITSIPAGNHTGKIMVKTKPGADLLTRVGLQIIRFQFQDGIDLIIAPDPDYSASRLAFPIHQRGQHNCHTFRIPAISKANDGSLLAVYDMRYHSRRDLQEHMDIGLSRSTDGGQTWAPPTPIMDMGEFGGKPQKENGCSDPGVLVDSHTGEVIVTACWTHGKPNTHQWRGTGSEPGYSIDKSTQFMAVRSKDHGKSWSQPENWTKALKNPSWHLFAPAPGNGISMKNGTLVMPTQGRDANGIPFSNITWSDDHGKTWTVSSHARDNTTECAVAELSDGSLMLNMRDNRNRRDKSNTNGRAIAITSNLGKQWKKHSSDHGALPEPTCMASLISHQQLNGQHLLFFSNPNNKNGRSNMTIQMSSDDGGSWPKNHRILLDSNGGAYSSLVIVDDKTIGILYESSAADMIFQKMPLRDFIDGQ